MTYAPPPVRSELEFQPTQVNDQQAVVVTDPFDILAEPLCLTEFALYLLGAFDGTRTASEIQTYLQKIISEPLSDGFVEQHAREFESLGLLLTDEIVGRRDSFLQAYGEQVTRPPAHAGEAYPAQEPELRTWVEDLLDSHHIEERETVSLLVAPHIDFRVNTEVYRQTYSHLRHRSYDRVIVLGTGHSLGGATYCVSRKNYATPLGETETDQDAVIRLEESGAGIMPEFDLAHRREHSIEFQVVLLQHLLGPANFKLIPILCGGFEPADGPPGQTRDLPGITPFLDMLQEICNEPGVKTLVVVGGDLSHIGRRFGHSQPARDLLAETQAHDKALLEIFCRGDETEFLRTGWDPEGRHNVCGFSALATVLATCSNNGTTQVAYSVWDDQSTDSAVSFAGLVG